jgi:hypothetical protein
MRTIAFALLALLVVPLRGAAQVPPGGAPLYHGALDILPTSGRLDRSSGMSTLHVRRWRYIVANDTNGLHPESERLVVAIGEGQNDFYRPPGDVQSMHGGRVFLYRASREDRKKATGLRYFRMVKHPAGAACSPLDPCTFTVSFSVAGIDLSGLFFNDPICVPIAVIVGDDDGFAVADVASPNFRFPDFISRRVSVRSGTCSADWPWLGR